MEFVAKHKHEFKNHRTHAERQQNEREENEMHSRIDKIPFHLAREQHERAQVFENGIGWCASDEACANRKADKIFLTKIYGLNSNQLTLGTQRSGSQHTTKLRPKPRESERDTEQKSETEGAKRNENR